MLRQKYVAGTLCHPIYAIINLYTVHIVIQVLGKFLTKWLKDIKQIKGFRMLQSYQVINLKTKREKYIPSLPP